MTGLGSRLRRRLRGGGDGGALAARAPEGLLDLLREGPAPLAPGGAARADAGGLRIGIVIPPFRHGSGGHSTLANLVRGLEARGHVCSLWLSDDEGRHATETDDETEALFKRFFGEVQAGLRTDLGGSGGADVVVATGWQTVPVALRVPGAAARAYLVQDHEPEFFATSAEAVWAADTYRQGLHCICASPWLAEVVRARYGASASHFDLGVDHEAYRPLGRERRSDLVVFYARAVTARRAVPLGLLALAELHRRRPALEIGLFGESRPLETPFPHRNLGILAPADLAAVYAEATVGMVLSMTNPSLIPTEMLACELPCVDLASDAMVRTFGAGGPVELGPFDPLGLADAIERLLDDPALRTSRAAAGRELVAERTWPRAAEQVEEGLRTALRAAR